MGRGFLNASNRYLEIAAIPHGNLFPITMHSWVYPEASITAMVMGFYDTVNTAAPALRMQQLSAGQNQATHRDPAGGGSTTQGAAASSNSYSLNSWFGYSNIFTNNASRTAYINGAGKVNNTTLVPNAMANNYTAIGTGRYNTNGSLSPYTGRIAECGYWNAVLNDDEILSLGKGINPSRIRPSNLLLHYPLNNPSSSGGENNVAKDGITYNLSQVNSPTVVDHAPVSPMFF